MLLAIFLRREWNAVGKVALRTILRPEASLIHDELLVINPAGYAPQTFAQLDNGRTVLATAYVQALRFRDIMRGRSSKFNVTSS